MTMTGIPDKEGFFWGRWHTPAPGTADDGEMCDGAEGAGHFVWDGWSAAEPFAVFVPGVAKAQPLDAFDWGEEVPRPAYAEVQP